jgi:hypothetical protein
MKFLVILLLSTGCASIAHGTKQDFWVNSIPSEAEVRIDGIPTGNTPILLELPRGSEHVLTLTRPGYEKYEMIIRREMSGWVWGNLLLFGIFGLVIDAMDGAWANLSPEAVDATLEPERRPPQIDTLHAGL